MIELGQAIFDHAVTILHLQKIAIGSGGDRLRGTSSRLAEALVTEIALAVLDTEKVIEAVNILQKQQEEQT